MTLNISLLRKKYGSWNDFFFGDRLESYCHMQCTTGFGTWCMHVYGRFWQLGMHVYVRFWQLGMDVYGRFWQLSMHIYRQVLAAVYARIPAGFGSWVCTYTAGFGSWVCTYTAGFGSWACTCTAGIGSWVCTYTSCFGSWVCTYTSCFGSWVCTYTYAEKAWSMDQQSVIVCHDQLKTANFRSTFLTGKQI